MTFSAREREGIVVTAFIPVVVGIFIFLNGLFQFLLKKPKHTKGKGELIAGGVILGVVFFTILFFYIKRRFFHHKKKVGADI